MIDIIEYLKTAQKLSIAGEYSEALSNVELALNKNPDDVEALRLKGNIIELKILDDALNNNHDFACSPEVLKARVCYEQALFLQPNHTGILADLGTHWKNFGDADRAIQFFEQVIALLPIYPSISSSASDDIVEALEGKIEILEARGNTNEAEALKQKLKLLQLNDQK